MKMTEKEKGILERFKRLESEKSRDDLIFHAETMVRAQEALMADYGLVGLDAPLFNGRYGLLPESYPVGRVGKELAQEAAI
jgi:hypothetical protein